MKPAWLQNVTATRSRGDASLGIVIHIPDHAEYLLLVGNKGAVQKGALNKMSPWATKTTLWKWLFTVPAPSFHSLHCERKQTHP